MAHWLLDELAHAGPEHLDAEFVAGYDLKQGHPDPLPDVRALREQGLDEQSTVVDLGAGTGRFAVAAAAAFARVVAVDISPVMVAHLRDTVEREHLTNLEVVRAGFLGYAHTGAAADAVTSRHGLHQVPDFWKAIALERMNRMLRPGGVLRVRDIIYDFEPAEADAVFADWFAGAADDPGRGYTAGDYSEHIRTEHSTFRWLFEPLLDRCGFDIVDTQYQGRLYGTYTCRKR